MQKAKYSKLKWITSGFLFGLILPFLLAWALFYLPVYQRAPTLKKAMESTIPLLKETKEKLLTNQSIGSIHEKSINPYVQEISRLAEGDIILITSEGQMIWFHLELTPDKALLHCFGSPQKLIHSNCPTI